MWDPTSDIKEDVESSSSSVSSSATTHTVEGIFEKTSSSVSLVAPPTTTKTTETTITDLTSVKTHDNNNDQTDLSKNCEFSEDSGFISGPQPTTTTTTIDDEISNDDKKLKNPEKQTKEEQTTVYALDSGCIDECVDDEEEVFDENNHHQKSSNNTPMLLDKGVDAGISEWFCKINLNDQQVNADGGSTMNNLGAASSSTKRNKKQKSKEATNATQARSADSVPKVNYSDAWEKFYQQNEDGDTPLHLACISGYIDIIAMLIRMAPHPCLLNIQNDSVQTAMHLAAMTGQPKILRMLIIAGAESCIRDHRGNTALHLACMSGDLQCVRALTVPISSSEINEAHRLYGHWNHDRTMSTLNCPAMMTADLELRNYDGERCVHIAAYKGHIEVLRHLINYGVDINAREGKSGRTALHIAVETCNDTLANFLLEECSKINLEAETYAGLTAYQFACVLDNSKMQNYLEKYGAEPLTPPDSDYDSSDIESDSDDSSQVSLPQMVA